MSKVSEGFEGYSLIFCGCLRAAEEDVVGGAKAEFFLERSAAPGGGLTMAPVCSRKHNFLCSKARVFQPAARLCSQRDVPRSEI